MEDDMTMRWIPRSPPLRMLHFLGGLRPSAVEHSRALKNFVVSPPGGASQIPGIHTPALRTLNKEQKEVGQYARWQLPKLHIDGGKAWP